jgi:hypothetical protein
LSGDSGDPPGSKALGNGGAGGGEPGDRRHGGGEAGVHRIGAEEGADFADEVRIGHGGEAAIAGGGIELGDLEVELLDCLPFFGRHGAVLDSLAEGDTVHASILIFLAADKRR